MYPILFRLGPLEIPAYGVMLATGILLAWAYFRKQFPPEADHEALASMVTFAILAGLAGSRINFMLEHLNEIHSLRDFAGMLFSRSGLTVYGGLIAGTATAWFYSRRHNLLTHLVLDAGAQSICIGYFFGRIGCQLAGDGDYGSPSTLPWAMAYPNGTIPTLERVHPTPVYEMILFFLLFIILRRARRTLAPGKTFSLFLVLAGMERFYIEILRTNPRVLWGWTEAQFVSVAIIVAGIAGFSHRIARDRAFQYNQQKK